MNPDTRWIFCYASYASSHTTQFWTNHERRFIETAWVERRMNVPQNAAGPFCLTNLIDEQNWTKRRSLCSMHERNGPNAGLH